ncbi:MAG: Holliday junction resolvase RuvX [Chitinophagaceae bacterium]|nr:Holliday junction resolvase RuvX [Chitinophagaceae bacterium]
MARILALDYGKKRTGIAVSDPLQIIATALETIETPQIFSFLHSYFLREAVECIVVGEPKNMNNTPSEISGDINNFIASFQQKFPAVPVKRIDERFTSKIASQTILAAGKNKKARRDKSLVDKVSAVIILQSYLASIQK